MQPRALAAALSLAVLAWTPLLAQEPSVETSALGKPLLHVEKKTLDFGDIKQGETLEATFEIENRGDADLVIFSARPS